jgi:parvulin-like peptidyl-prolyl isomerase
LIEYGSAKNAEADLKRLYGWDLDDFLKKVVEPQMHKEKLEDLVENDDEIELNKRAKENALNTLSRLKAGEDFTELAKEISEGESAALGGDLGYFKEGVMVPEFEEVAFSLKVGEFSNIVKTRYGYHLIKVEDKKGSEIKARHILFRTKSFSTWFDEKKSEMDIKVNVDGLKYDTEVNDVIFENEDYNERLKQTEKRIKEELEGEE